MEVFGNIYWWLKLLRFELMFFGVILRMWLGSSWINSLGFEYGGGGEYFVMLFYYGNFVIVLLLGERVVGELIRYGGYCLFMGEDIFLSIIYEWE